MLHNLTKIVHDEPPTVGRTSDPGQAQCRMHGGRMIGDACHLLHQVILYLTPGCLPIFSSDGLNQYFYAITAHFGFWDKPPQRESIIGFPMYVCSMLNCEVTPGTQVTSSTLQFGLVLITLSGRYSWVWNSPVWCDLRMLKVLISPCANGLPLSTRTWSIAYDRYPRWLHIRW